MHRVVAKYVQDSLDVAALRSVLNATGEAPAQYASLLNRLDKIEAQLGLTPLGLQKNRWVIVTDELAEKREEVTGAPSPAPVAPRRRLKVAGGTDAVARP
jgi:hypothetical protein